MGFHCHGASAQLDYVYGIPLFALIDQALPIIQAHGCHSAQQVLPGIFLQGEKKR
jgi:hypothetical protein